MELIDDNGDVVQMEHAYYRGEKEYDGFKLDGYACVDNENIFYEFLGCRFHNCPSCYGGPPDKTWLRKKAYLEGRGKLIYIWECKWRSEAVRINQNSSGNIFDTPEFPLIMKKTGNENDILSGIRAGNIFGFIVCDVVTPEEVIERIKYLNFPPVIQRMDVEEAHLSEYMSGRVQSEGTKLPRNTVVQTFNAKQILLYSPLVQFYMKLGMKITKITKFIQYKPGIVMKEFVKQITEGRIKAIEEKKSNLGLAYKTVGNR